MSEIHPDELQITKVAHCQNVENGRHLRGGFFKIIANQPLWETLGKVPTGAGLKLERVLLTSVHKDDLPYALVAKPNTPLLYNTEAWIEGPTSGPGAMNLNKDVLNARLQTIPRPTINIIQSPLGPDLLLCHRSVPFGRFLKESIQRVRGIQHADIVQTGEGAQGIFSAYDEGKLLGATLVPPATSFEATANAIRDLATI